MNFAQTKKVEPKNKSYFSSDEALLDLGFTYEGKFTSQSVAKIFVKEIYKDKNGKLWAFKEMDHFNTEIYSISLTRFVGDESLVLD